MRIVTFGDSFTYGHGLEDCWVNDKPGPMPSSLAWPALLGDNVSNRSVPGASNTMILHDILHSEFKPDDYVIIMWTFPDRDMIFDTGYFLGRKDRAQHIGPWRKDDLTKSWMLTHNSTDSIIRAWYHIHHANLFLDSLGVKHYNFFIDYTHYRPHKPLAVDIPMKVISTVCMDLALDNLHPGPKTHERIARDIKECII
jgi:lysophospholipase L1-like esterase